MASLWARSRRLGIVVLFLVAALCVVCASFFLGGTPPAEEKLLNTVHNHGATYERLRVMLLEDQQVRAVYARSGVETTKSGLPRTPSEVNFSVDRYNEYVALLKQSDSAEVFRARPEDNSEICIAVWASGFGGDTRHVDSCWLDHAPLNQVTSLDEFYKTAKPRRPVFRHIDGNWYLRADW